MRMVLVSPQYKRDVARLHKKHFDTDLLTAITKVLQREGVAPLRTDPHKLHGKWKNFFECHVGENWLLIYKTDDQFVYLYRTGSHDELF